MKKAGVTVAYKHDVVSSLDKDWIVPGLLCNFLNSQVKVFKTSLTRADQISVDSFTNVTLKNARHKTA